MLRHRLRLLVRYAQGVVGLLGDDVLLASFPRSGSTWVRFFLCNVISLREMEGRTVGFPLLDATMPELGADDLRTPWAYDTIPRVVKTHRPYSRWLAGAGRSVLVVRDPRDAMVSLFHYERGKRHPRIRGELSDLLRHPRLGLPAWFRHYRSWTGRSDLTLGYEELVADPRGELERLLAFLGADEEDRVITEAVERARFRNVRRVEATRGHSDEGKFGSDFRFARKGESGGWRAHFSEADLEYYRVLHEASGIEVYAP